MCSKSRIKTDANITNAQVLSHDRKMKSLSMDFSSMLERSCAPPEIIEQEHAIKSGATAMKAKATQENDAKPVIAVVGVGYVGSHLVEAFAKIYEVIAFDVSKVRIEEIARHFEGLTVRATSHPPDLAAADAFLISVPTILNADKSIDTTFLERAVHTIAEQARDGSIVVVESTVAVGMTRHFLSSLATTKTLKVGMSPEVYHINWFQRAQLTSFTRELTQVASSLPLRVSQRLFRV